MLRVVFKYWSCNFIYLYLVGDRYSKYFIEIWDVNGTCNYSNFNAGQKTP